MSGTATGYRVLVVDDDFETAESIFDTLEEHGYEAILARNGRDALDKLQGLDPLPGLILLDLMMPVMDGAQFRAEQVRRPSLSAIPTVVMSAYGDGEARSEELKASAYLRKPIKIGALLDVCRLARPAQADSAALPEPRRAALPARRAAPRPSDCLMGGGEMGDAMRHKDWSSNPLGPVNTWPQSLRTAVSICLGTSFPMMIAWGPDLLMVYNDSYRPVLGTLKHPGALGQPLLEVFHEIRDVLQPMFGGVMDTGEPIGAEDMLFVLERHGYPEETYFVFSYSPIRDESGGVGGVLTTCTETTHRVVGARRLKALRILAARAAHATTAEEALVQAAASFDAADFPFALLYLLDAEGGEATLAASFGLPAGDPASPPRIALNDAAAVWPLQDVCTGEPLVIEALDERIGPLRGGPWPEPIRQAVILAIARPGVPAPYGFLIAGVSPRRPLEESYRGFFELVADQLASAVANARVHEEERRRAAALAELDRAKTVFFSNVSHEFRTPLTLLLGPLDQLLSRPGLTPALRAELEAMQRNANRLLKLVNTLLDFSRIEAGRARALFEPTDLATLTADLAGIFRSAAERAGLQLIVDCPPLPERVWVDASMWEKIVLNLLSNALKFTLEGEIGVRLGCAGDRVTLEVWDTGSGIPAADLPRIFDRFHRVQDVRARSHEGTGIGLALVRDLVLLHGGDIAVESQLGRGATFRVALPRGFAHLPSDQLANAGPLPPTAIQAGAFVDEALRWLREAPEDGAALEPAAELPPAFAATAGARVLVADDNADMRQYLARLLGQHWTVELVADGQAAWDAALQSPPDLVLADVMMPGLDGFALLRRLRSEERTRRVPIVMLSARAGEEARIEGLQAGADDYLVKPFSARELVARLASLLILARARQAVELQRDVLHSLFHQAPTPICILHGPRHVIEFVNAACAQVWSRQPHELLGRPLVDALPEIAGQPFPSLLDDVFTTGEVYVGREAPATIGPADKPRTVFFNFVYAPKRDFDGRIDGVFVLAFDVTEEVQSREELQRTVRESELFTGILGHDLRNPLSAILTTAQVMLMRHAGVADIERSAKRIVSSGERMARLIEQLLTYTRCRVGQGIPIRREPTDLAELVSRVLLEVETAHPGWRVAIDSVGDASGEWDPDRLAQVLSNLAANAAQHGTPETAARVVLDGRDPASIRLTIANQGAIPDNLLPVLFDPFRGADHHRRRQGLGLGLYITREIVRAHGGELTVSSSSETGTSFTVLLPRATATHTSAAGHA